MCVYVCVCVCVGGVKRGGVVFLPEPLLHRYAVKSEARSVMIDT